MAKEGLIIILFSWALVAVGWLSAWHFRWAALYGLAVVLTLLGLFVLYFFRDPQRTIPLSEKVIVSPADGKVVEIKEVDEPEFLKEKTVRISIFLSVFNVHVNRIPLAGTVKFKKYYPGKFLVAFNEKASLENEQSCLGIEGKNGFRYTVKQIAGIVARRIICHAQVGRHYETGERFGLIRFGSRADIFLPRGTLIKVKVGDRVAGGTSILGEIP